MDAPFDQLGNAVCQRGRLACARSGDDQQRLVAVPDGLSLLGIQLLHRTVALVFALADAQVEVLLPEFLFVP
jgi:hypothetical protein